MKKESQNYGGLFDLPRLKTEIEELEEEIAQPDFWKDAQAAAKVTRRKASIERDIQRVSDLERHYGDLQAMDDLIGEQEDPELQNELNTAIQGVETTLEQWRLERLLSGEHDQSPAILSINPGAGGTESQDWARCSCGCMFGGRSKGATR